MSGSNHILHTDASRASSPSYPSAQDWNQFAIGYLKGQEQKLYGMLGASDFQGFMNKIHELLDEAEGVRDILARFKKGNLVKTFDLPETLPLMNQEIRLICTGAKNISFASLFGGLKGSNFTVDIPNEVLTFTYNAETAKTLMSYLEGRSNTRREFKTDTNSMNRVNKAFKNWIQNTTNIESLIEIEVGGRPVNVNMVTQTTDKAKNLFGFKLGDIEKAITDDPQLKQRITSARWQVYNELLNLCSGNFELQSAFDTVWKNKMGSIADTSDKAISKFIFLSKGGNLTAGVSGAIQEMYGALLLEYLRMVSKKNLPKGLVEIIGNIAEGAEQPKADLTILNQLGIQVKAYGMDNVIKHMESNLHPNALDAQLQPYGAVNVGDAIVQSVFNTDNESPNSIASTLRNYAAALLNLSTSAGLDIKNTVCFYLIDASYLVPGSEILNAFNATNPQQKSEYDVKITSAYKGKSTTEYNALTYVSSNARHYKTRPTTRLSPGFIEFFDKAGTEQIHADSKNESTYESLYTSSISIRTIFDYGFVGNNNIFRIF